MAYTTINKPSDYFNTKIYTGNQSSTHAVTGVGFEPSLTWLKNRSGTGEHYLFDAIRGVTKGLNTNSNSEESTYSYFSSFDTDGFTLGSASNNVNGAYNYASWNWKANGQGSSNTDGSINTTYTSVNTTAGFSICKYQGTGSNATVGHGLGAVPKMIIFKNLTQSINWIVYSSELNISSSNCLRLNGTNAAFTESAWNGTRPTTSVFSLGTHNEANNSSGETIAYCFAEKQGYSKFGSYRGNGNADGAFVYTGFKPAWIVIKRTDNTADWELYDSKRLGYNSSNPTLYPNTTSIEGGNGRIDILSNGFKIVTTSGNLGAANGNYIYMAFAEAPLVGTNNVPCTAR